MQNCLHFVSAALFFQLNQTGILGPHCLVSSLEAFFFLNDAISFIGFFVCVVIFKKSGEDIYRSCLLLPWTLKQICKSSDPVFFLKEESKRKHTLEQNLKVHLETKHFG